MICLQVSHLRIFMAKSQPVRPSVGRLGNASRLRSWRGDVVWLRFSPQVGHEQPGRRPAVVLSRAEYNKKVGLALLCPVTSQVKGYLFEVAMPSGFAVVGVALSDQIKNLDWKKHHAVLIDRLPVDTLSETT